MTRVAIAWVLWGMGYALCMPMRRFEWAGWLYPAYNRLMIASSAVQGKRRRGPWGEEH